MKHFRKRINPFLDKFAGVKICRKHIFSEISAGNGSGPG
jgi:hypothetical protein